jgi:hypothetical protein
MARALPTVLLLSLLAWIRGVAAPVDLLPAGFEGAMQPQVSLDIRGEAHLVFGKGTSVYYIRSDDGTHWSAPALVGSLPKLALGLRRGPRIVTYPGKLLVTAISHEDGDLHAWTSTDGKTWAAQPALNTTPRSAREGLHALASDGVGNVAVTWLDLRLGKMSLWAKFSADGGRRWTDDRLVYASPDGPICQCCAPAVAFAADGRIGFLWRNLLQGARDLYLSETTDSLRFTPARKLGQGTWLLNACPMDGGSLAYGPEGKTHPVWKRERTLFAGDDLAMEAKLAQPAAQAVTAYIGATPLTVWESNGVLMLQRGDAPPGPYAPGGKFASIDGRGNRAVVAYEGMADGHRTILAEIIK